MTWLADVYYLHEKCMQKDAVNAICIFALSRRDAFLKVTSFATFFPTITIKIHEIRLFHCYEALSFLRVFIFLALVATMYFFLSGTKHLLLYSNLYFNRVMLCLSCRELFSVVFSDLNDPTWMTNFLLDIQTDFSITTYEDIYKVFLAQ